MPEIWSDQLRTAWCNGTYEVLEVLQLDSVNVVIHGNRCGARERWRAGVVELFPTVAFLLVAVTYPAGTGTSSTERPLLPTFDPPDLAREASSVTLNPASESPSSRTHCSKVAIHVADGSIRW
jgi:hypothetical protein